MLIRKDKPVTYRGELPGMGAVELHISPEYHDKILPGMLDWALSLVRSTAQVSLDLVRESDAADALAAIEDYLETVGSDSRPSIGKGVVCDQGLLRKLGFAPTC
jgi:hypothetical protein